MGLDAMDLYRWSRSLQQRGVPLLPALMRKGILVLFSSYIPPEAEIGAGTVLGYGGIGVVIHGRSKIGRDCIISQHVTIGGRSGHEGVPVIGDGVRIGAGAVILGNVRVGDFAVIGANAVVVKDVEPATVVAGVPARVLRTLEEPAVAYARETGQPVPENVAPTEAAALH